MFPNPFPQKIKYCCLEKSDLVTFPVHEEEKTYIESVKSERRQNEFLLGRACAHQALSAFQLSHLPILKNNKKAPIWPQSIVGSITHTGDWAAAAVGKQDQVQGIGLDLENLERPVRRGIQKRICISEEQEWLAQQPRSQSDIYLKILFSAKESIFKCLYPLTGIYLNFQDAHIVFDTDVPCFKFRLLKDCGTDFPLGFQHEGIYQILQSLVMTSIWISA